MPAGKQVTMGYVIEIEGEAKPACVAEFLVLLLARRRPGSADPVDHQRRAGS